MDDLAQRARDAGMCGDVLLEPGWEEGFVCVRAAGHEGPHRMTSWSLEQLTGVDIGGRSYVYSMEWKYQ